MAFVVRRDSPSSVGGMGLDELPGKTGKGPLEELRGISGQASSNEESGTDVASRASEAVYQYGLCAVSGRRQRSNNAGHASSGHRYIHIIHTGDLLFRLRYKTGHWFSWLGFGVVGW